MLIQPPSPEDEIISEEMKQFVWVENELEILNTKLWDPISRMIRIVSFFLKDWNPEPAQMCEVNSSNVKCINGGK